MVRSKTHPTRPYLERMARIIEFELVENGWADGAISAPLPMTRKSECGSPARTAAHTLVRFRALEPARP